MSTTLSMTEILQVLAAHKDVVLEAVERSLSEGSGKILSALVVGLGGAYANLVLKRRRLRSAIRADVELTSRFFGDLFTPAAHADLEARLTADPTYLVVILTSKRSIISNLSDDISFLPKRMARRIVSFNDVADLVDDAIRFMRTDEFARLPNARKLAVLAVPFDQQDELQGYAMQLLGEL